jgi:hypothetical protein
VNDFNLRKFLVENKLTPQSLLNKSEDDEYNIDASPEWNAREVTVGSKISVDDFKPEIISSLVNWGNWLKNQPPHIDIFKNGFIITGIKYKDKYFVVRINGTGKYLTYNFDEVDPNKVTLVSESIIEQDDYEEFTIDNPSEEWGAKELTVGSVVTPDMWSESTKNDPNNLSTPWSARALKEPVTITNIEYDSEVFYTRDNSGEFNNTTQWYFDELNPSKAYIAPFEEMNESDEDEFTVDSPSEKWNIEELTVGDTITPDMWIVNNKLRVMYPQIYESNFTITKINLKNKEFWANSNKGFFSKLINKDEWFSSQWINPNKAILIEPLTEQDEDEFDVTPSEDWGAQELTVGSTITPDMWTEKAKKDPMNLERERNLKAFSQNVVIKDIWNNNTFLAVEEGDEGLETMSQWYFDELDPTKAIIVPESLDESDEDDFSEPIEASPEWGAQELTIGSRVTPDMWNKEAYDYFSKYGPKWVIRPEVNAVIYEIEEDGNGDIWIKLLWKPKKENKATFPYRTDFINTNVLNNAYIVPPLNESDEDEFDNPIEASPEWGAQELTVGSVITPDMWSEEAKNDFTNVNQEKYAIAFSQNVVIKQLWDKGYTFGTVPENDEDGEMVAWYSTELDPTKAYIKGSEQDPNLFEQDEDDFSEPIEANPEWNAQELTTKEGSNIITPDMWAKKEITMKVYPELFKNNFKITKIDDDGFFINKKVNGKYGTTSWTTSYFSFDDLDPTKVYIVPQN